MIAKRNCTKATRKQLANALWQARKLACENGGRFNGYELARGKYASSGYRRRVMEHAAYSVLSSRQYGLRNWITAALFHGLTVGQMIRAAK